VTIDESAQAQLDRLLDTVAVQAAAALGPTGALETLLAGLAKRILLDHDQGTIRMAPRTTAEGPSERRYG
jgi:hypothetical protein